MRIPYFCAHVTYKKNELSQMGTLADYCVKVGIAVESSKCYIYHF